MSWFKNLNATPRLMLSFGILIVLIAAISYLAIVNLSQANDRMEVLYHEDMLGSMQAADINIARMSLGRQGRDAALHMDDPAVVAADKKTMLANFVTIHSNLDAAEKTFYTTEGKAVIATMRDALPAYEKAYHDLYERAEAKDLTGAKTVLTAVTAVGQPLYDAADRALALKQTRGEEKFQANNQSYNSARSLILAAAAISLTLGVILSILIARGFSVPLSQAAATLGLVAGGDLTVSLDVDTKDEVGRMATALNTALEKLRFTLQEVSAKCRALELLVAGAGSGSTRDCQRGAGAGGQPGRNVRQPGRNHSRSPAKRGQRQAGQPTGDRVAGVGRKRSGRCFQRNCRDGRDQCHVSKDFGHHLDHQRDCLSNQLARSQRSGRGCPCGRRGPRLCGGGNGSKKPCAA